jgi:hypothetical protein
LAHNKKERQVMTNNTKLYSECQDNLQSQKQNNKIRIYTYSSPNQKLCKRIIKNDDESIKVLGAENALIGKYQEHYIDHNINSVGEFLDNLSNDIHTALLVGTKRIANDSLDSHCNIIRRSKTSLKKFSDKQIKVLPYLIKKYGINKHPNYFLQSFLEPAKTYTIHIDIDNASYESLGLSQEAKLIDVGHKLPELLPIEFRNVSFHMQRSGSAGFKDNHLFKGHITFLSENPVYVQDIKLIALYINQYAAAKNKHYQENPLCDTSIYSGVSLLYYARNIESPEIEDAFIDDRSTIIEGEYQFLNTDNINYQSTLEINSDITNTPAVKTRKSKKNSKTSSTKHNIVSQNDQKTAWQYWDKYNKQDELVPIIESIDKNLHNVILALTMWLAKKQPDAEGRDILKALCNSKRAGQDEWTKEFIEQTFNEALAGAKFKSSVWNNSKLEIKKEHFEKEINEIFIDNMNLNNTDNLQVQYNNQRYFDLLNVNVEQNQSTLMIGGYNQGKSYCVKHSYPKQNELTRMFIASRVALVENIGKDNQAAIYDQIKKDIPIQDLEVLQEQGLLDDIATTANSAPAFPIPQQNQKSMLNFDEPDEGIEQIIGTTSYREAKASIVHLIKRIEQTKHIVFTQALMSPTILKILKLAQRENTKIIINKYQAFKGNKVYKYEDEQVLIDQIIRCVQSENKCAVATNTKEKANEIAELVEKILPKATICITSETKNNQEQKDFIKDKENGLKLYKVVIYSPTVSSGNSFENEDYDITFGFYENHKSAAGPLAFCQALHRNRCSKELHIYIKDVVNLNLPDTVEKLIQAQENAGELKGKVINKSIKSLLNQHITENGEALTEHEIKLLQRIQDKLKLEKATVQTFERDEIDMIMLEYQARDNFFKNHAGLSIEWILKESMGYEIETIKKQQPSNLEEKAQLLKKKEQRLLEKQQHKEKRTELIIKTPSMDQTELSQARTKKKDQQQQIAYNKGRIEEVTGLRFQNLEEKEKANLIKFMGEKCEKGTPIIRNFEISLLDSFDAVLLGTYPQQKNDYSMSKTILKWIIFKSLFNLFGITYKEGEITIPENTYFLPETVINSPFGRMVKKYWFVFNDLGIGKLDEEGLTPIKFGNLLKKIGLVGNRIKVYPDTLLGALDADMPSTIKDKKEEMSASNTINLINIDKDFILRLPIADKQGRVMMKCLTLNPFVLSAFEHRIKTEEKTVLTFAAKLRREYTEYQDLSSWYQAIEQQDVEVDRDDIKDDVGYIDDISLGIKALNEAFVNTPYGTSGEMYDNFEQLVEENDIELPTDFWRFASSNEQIDKAQSEYLDSVNKFLNMIIGD